MHGQRADLSSRQSFARGLRSLLLRAVYLMRQESIVKSMARAYITFRICMKSMAQVCTRRYQFPTVHVDAIKVHSSHSTLLLRLLPFKDSTLVEELLYNESAGWNRSPIS
jgi:hypothetical protein